MPTKIDMGFALAEIQSNGEYQQSKYNCIYFIDFSAKMLNLTLLSFLLGFLVAQSVKNLPSTQGTWVRFLGQKIP